MGKWKNGKKDYKMHLPQVSRTPLLTEVQQRHEVYRTTVRTDIKVEKNWSV